MDTVLIPDRFQSMVLQDVRLYAMLSDAAIKRHLFYPFPLMRDVWYFEWRYDSSYRRVFVFPEPLPVEHGKLRLLKGGAEKLRIGRRDPSGKYQHGKNLYVKAYRLVNNVRQSNGQNQSFCWCHDKQWAFVRDGKWTGRRADYIENPLTIQEWRIMLPSELRAFCGIIEEDWQDWYKKYASVLNPEVFSLGG